jgi:pyruvate, orthophosphate dikinase
MSGREGQVLPATQALEDVLDEHAELGEILVQIAGAADLRVLRGLLARLAGFCARHFAREEQTGYPPQGSPDGAPARELLAEHRALLESVRRLEQRIAGGELPFQQARSDAGLLVRRLRDHDDREASLLREHAGVEMGAAREGGRTRSSALEVNLRRTAVDVAIPPEQRVLLECTAHLHGVHEATQALLREIHHRYVGWEQTLEDLHHRAMGDLSYYLDHPHGAEAVEVFLQLYEKAAREASSEDLREAALRRYLQYLLKLVDDEPHWPQLRGGLIRATARLRALLEAAPDRALAASSGLRKLAEALVAVEGGATGEAAEAGLSLLAVALERVYACWLEGEDPADWWRSLAQAPPDAPVPEAVAALSHARLAAHRERVGALVRGSADERARLLALPDHARLARACIAAAVAVEPSEAELWRARLIRVRWLLHVLAAPHLSVVHEDALAEIQHASARVLREAQASSATPVVHELFASLRARGLSTSRPALALLGHLGREALSARDPAWTEAFIDRMLDWDFAVPEFSGFTESWQLRANPSHVGAIRTFLALVEARPEAARPLVAALVVHLRLGGVALADTDLFQRDVSKLLASGVAPILHPVKHLLRLLPIYFNEIGAEGELRDVSTRIDELSGRGDPLCHFLRKQCHVECNPELIGLIEATAHYWARADREPLRRYLPAAMWEALGSDGSLAAGMHAVFAELSGEQSAHAVLASSEDDFEKRLAGLTSGSELDREKAHLLYRLRRLVGEKYELRHDDVLERLEASRVVAASRLAALREALAAGDDASALDGLLQVIQDLQEIALRPGPVEAHEQIYRKRHIAVGIPSLYGAYREERFEAMGLSLRVESLASALFDRLLASDPLLWITRGTLRRVLGWLHLLRRALWIDGCRARGLSTGIALFEQALEQEGFDAARWRNVFQLLARSVEQIVRIRFREVYEPILDRILPRMVERGLLHAEPGEAPHAFVLKRSEALLRELLAGSFGLQQLDALVGRGLRALARAEDALGPERATLLLGYDASRACVDLDGEPGPLDGSLHLGNKGYLLERLTAQGLPIPPGFVLTADIFRFQALFEACPELEAELEETVRGHVRRLESRTGRRFGDARRPLLLSVRSTSALSMPGVLDSFLNVGINAEIAEGFGRDSGSPWAAWDAWRRFLQLWGMAFGVERDAFDALMREAKRRHGVEKKAELSPEQMKDLAFRYRELVASHGVRIEEDPLAQLRACLALVLRSWETETARLYRHEMQIAEGWGTAVVVQSMVYGNLHQRSGTGVLRTYTPRGRPGDVGITGDYIVQGQGDDVVSGLVDTFPVEAGERSETLSLERRFPDIHAALLQHARALVLDTGAFHQEVEFTFESDRPEDLYVLQTRDRVLASASAIEAFAPSPELEAAKLATGIGAGGGALCGRVAHGAQDIASLRSRFPGDPILLLRPDTVPDDIPLVLRCDGMVTARGGATSHAALVAQRLGRTCVVGCRALEVCEGEGRSRIGEHEVESGDWLSINGIDGSVYLGRHPTVTVGRERLA